MTVYALDPLQDTRWPEFLERHPHASVFHSPGWLSALCRTYGYEPIAYTTTPPGAELANGLVFCRINSWLTGRRLVSLPFSDHSQPLSDNEETLREILASLDRERKGEGWKYIEVRPLCDIGQAAQTFSTTSRFVFHSLDLRPPLDVLFRGFHEDSIRRKIRRAQREGLTCEAGQSDELLHKFYGLLVMSCRKKRLPPQPLKWFRHLVACLGDRLTIRVASKNSRPVASILTISFKRSMVYKYGCSDPGFLPLGGNILLLWEAIQDAKRTGCLELDLGRSDEHQHGLVTFKDRWGTTRSVSSYLRRSANTAPAVSTSGSLHIAQRIFARMPDNLLVAAGRMLYRHVG
jgi:hypothetical protein